MIVLAMGFGVVISFCLLSSGHGSLVLTVESESFSPSVGIGDACLAVGDVCDELLLHQVLEVLLLYLVAIVKVEGESAATASHEFERFTLLFCFLFDLSLFGRPLVFIELAAGVEIQILAD